MARNGQQVSSLRSLLELSIPSRINNQAHARLEATSPLNIGSGPGSIWTRLESQQAHRAKCPRAGLGSR
eukprot:175062-Alexandrium_andersonii.AAC.1